MREFVVIGAHDPAIYARAVRKMQARGFRFEPGESGLKVAEPCYWVVADGAWVVWQWEPGEPPHPGWVTAHRPITRFEP